MFFDANMSQMGNIFLITKNDNTKLTGCDKTGNHTSLVGMQNGIITLKTNLSLYYKVKHTLTI